MSAATGPRPPARRGAARGEGRETYGRQELRRAAASGQAGEMA
jgi:hypothetical protein